MEEFDGCRAGYDAVADEYVRRLFDELQHKPLDRQLLDRFAARVGGDGPACDLGCGPGQVAHYLHGRGLPVCGIDLSPEMVARARLLTPGVEFRQGDLRALDAPDKCWAGVAAFYSLIHVPRGQMTAALGEIRRVLRPGGVLLLAFHIGESVLRLEEWWGRKVRVDFFFFQPSDMAGYLEAAGLEVEETVERDPYPGVEHPSRRAYIFARRPGRD